MAKNTEIVSILGSGRSGTHLLGHLVDTSKKVTSSIEDKELFPFIVDTITQKKAENIPKIVEVLKKRVSECPTSIYLEKSHPMIWLANDSDFHSLPIKYIGIVRDPYATVASMLEHKGVRKWCEEWEKLPQPNIFLGTSRLNIEEYRQMSITQRCAMRWASHTKELMRLTYIMGEDKYLLVQYEDLLNLQKKSTEKIEKFVGVKDISKKYELKKDSLEKWKKSLGAQQIGEIKEIANYYCDEYSKLTV